MVEDTSTCFEESTMWELPKDLSLKRSTACARLRIKYLSRKVDYNGCCAGGG